MQTVTPEQGSEQHLRRRPQSLSLSQCRDSTPPGPSHGRQSPRGRGHRPGLMTGSGNLSRQGYEGSACEKRLHVEEARRGFNSVDGVGGTGMNQGLV